MNDPIHLWPEDWVKPTKNINEAVGVKNRLTVSRLGKRLVSPFIRQEFWNVLIMFYQQLHMGRKDIGFGLK